MTITVTQDYYNLEFGFEFQAGSVIDPAFLEPDLYAQLISTGVLVDSDRTGYASRFEESYATDLEDAFTMADEDTAPVERPSDQKPKRKVKS